MALPKDFKQEVGTGKYTLSNLKSGSKVKFRILSDFITGKSVWGEVDGKRTPTRRRAGEAIPVGAIGTNRFTGKPETIKQFLAAVVYNYTTSQVEIFETDKSTIIEQIVQIENDEDWGDTKNFDLAITKTGEDMETKYTVLPSNKDKFILPIEWKHVNLEALFTNDDPFADDEPTVPRKVEEAKDISDDIPF